MTRKHGGLRHHVFMLLWLFIIIVSVIDGYLVLEYRRYLDELNPQGQLLITLNNGNVWYLLGTKFFGTVVASAILRVIYENRAHLGTLITIIVATLQLGLLLFLLLM